MYGRWSRQPGSLHSGQVESIGYLERTHTHELNAQSPMACFCPLPVSCNTTLRPGHQSAWKPYCTAPALPCSACPDVSCSCCVLEGTCGIPYWALAVLCALACSLSSITLFTKFHVERGSWLMGLELTKPNS